MGSSPGHVAGHDRGKLSKAESHALDAEYRLQRNLSLQLKNRREQMLSAKARGELIEKKLVQTQALFLLRGCAGRRWPSRRRFATGSRHRRPARSEGGPR